MNAKCAVLLVLIAVGFVDAKNDGDACEVGANGWGRWKSGACVPLADNGSECSMGDNSKGRWAMGVCVADGRACTTMLIGGTIINGDCQRNCSTDKTCTIGSCHIARVNDLSKDFYVCYVKIFDALFGNGRSDNVFVAQIQGITCFGTRDYQGCKTTAVLAGICVAGNCYASCEGGKNCGGIQKCVKVIKEGSDSGKNVCVTSTTFAKMRTLLDYSTYDFKLNLM